MNRKLLLLILFSGIISQVQAQLKKDTLLLAITSAHTRAFSKENLILSRLQAQDLTSWEEAVSAVNEFVKKKASSLVKYSDKISSISNELINLLKVTFNGYIASTLKNPKDKKEGLSRIDASKIDLAKINISGIEDIIKPLDASKNELIQMQDELDKKLKEFRKSRITSKEKGDAVEVLIRLALTLETTISKVINDTKKLADVVEETKKEALS